MAIQSPPKSCNRLNQRASVLPADSMGPRAVTEHVEQPAVRVVPVPLVGHVAHVLQPADILLDERSVPGRIRGRASQRARLRPAHGRLPANPATAVPALQPQ